MKEDKTKRAKFSSPFVSLLEGLGEGLVFILLFLFFLLPFSASAQTDTIRYVNAQTGKYANDGKSWDKAKDNVQDAINDLYDYMQRNNLHSGSVYVAAGKYYPSESTGSGSSVLSTSFKIYDGIHLYGGFNPKNPEATPDQRKLSSAPQWKADDPKAKNKPTGSETDRPIGMAANDTIMSYDFKYATILSGNHSTVMGKFDWNNNKKQYDTRFPGNSYHVLWFATNGFCKDDAGKETLFADSLVYGASVDGCVIEDGNASGRTTTERDLTAFGGGAYMVQHATLSNCVVRRCSASRRGGGIYMDRGGTVKHCYIYQCQTLGIGVTDGYGGGVCMENNGALRKSVITNNMARVGGGLMIVYTPEEHPYSTSKYTKDGFDPYASTCIINNNNANTEGGGVALYKGGVLNHCTITNNECTGTDITINNIRYGRTGGLYVYGAGSAFNSVVWGNTCAANNDIQFGYNNASNIFKLATAQRPRLSYMAFSNYDITDWGNSLRSNVFQLDKSNFTASKAGNYPIFEVPSKTAGVNDALLYSPTQWKLNSKSYLEMKGVQVSQLTAFGNMITKSHSARDIFGAVFNPVSALGAVAADEEDYEIAMLPAVDGSDPSTNIPTLFVDPNRVINSLEGKTGNSWDTPLDNVSEAVYDMEKYLSSNKSWTGKTQILVKQGLVTAAGPSSYLYDLQSGEADLQSAALHLLSNMLMYGGYSSKLTGTQVTDYTVEGTGEKIVARNPKENVTRITGNIVDDYKYNSVHCVIFPNVHDAVLDGFYISYGNAEKPDDPTYNGNDAEDSYTYRQAYGYGSGIFIGARSRAERTQDMTGNIVRNCVISNCWAPMGGAAVFVSGDNYMSDNPTQLQKAALTMENCVIHNNAVRNKQDKNTVNQWRASAGIIQAVSNASITLNHCTVVNNVGNVFAAVKHNGNVTPTITVTNSAIYANATDSLGDRSELKADGSNLASLYYSGSSGVAVAGRGNQVDLLYSDKGMGTVSTSDYVPTFGNSRTDDHTYPRFANPVRTIFVQQNADDPTLYGGLVDYTPMDMNPMVNAATVATSEDPSKETDFALHYRAYGGAPDIGAIENTRQPENGSTYYVRTNGSNSNNGLSWSKAFKTLTYALQQAKNNGVKNIWIAAGTYKEGQTVNMVAGVNVYGGFKAYGNPGKREGERDISNLDATYQTILDGSGNKRVVYGSGITTATMWEGLTMQNGKFTANNTTTNAGGVGAYLGGTGITLKNCLVRNNYLTTSVFEHGGAGIYLSGGKVIDCIVRNNIIYANPKGSSAGIYMYGGTVINTMIVENASDYANRNNSSNILGLALAIKADNTKYNKLYNCTFAYNIGWTKSSGAISPSIWDFNDYTTDETAKGMARFYNCIFWGNTGYGNTGENYNTVCRHYWTDKIGLPGILYDCYHSIPCPKFANEGVVKGTHTLDKTVVSTNPTVYKYQQYLYNFNIFDNNDVIPGSGSAYNKDPYPTRYIDQCASKDLFSESKYKLKDGTSVSSYDGKRYFFTDNPYSINPASDLAKFCINMGSEVYGTELTQTLNVTEDIAGADRIQDCRIDKGAYEYNGSNEIKPETGTEKHRVYSTVDDLTGTEKDFNVATYYVSQNGGGVANASNAANAACNGKLQQVLDAAGRYKYANPKAHVIVKLAAVPGGGYEPSRTTDYNTNLDVNPRQYSIQIPHGVEVQGGWNDEFKERDPLNKKTLLKGGFNYDEGTSTAYHVVTFTDYVFDENGNRIATGKTGDDGLPIYEKLSDVITTYKATWEQTPGDNLFSRSLLNGCFIEGGEADGVLEENQRGGAAVVTDFADISNCVIQNNSASGYGGGLYVQSSGIVSGCIIQDNNAAYGAGIAIEEPDTSGLSTWSILAYNTIVYNGNETSTKNGGGIFFNTNLRSIGNVVWMNKSSDQSDIAGVVNVDAVQDVWNFPVNYTAVTNVREAGVNNISVSGMSDQGLRWQADDKLKTEERVYQYYAMQKSSVLARAALPYQTMRSMIRFFPGIDSVDIAGVKRMSQTANDETAYDGTSLVVKDNVSTDIGARAINASYDVAVAKVFYRLFVVHPSSVSNDKANKLLDSDDEIYKQVGSSFANPFQRLGDAFDYIMHVRQREESSGDTTPEKDKPRNHRFEVFVAGGTYYPYTNMYGEQGAVRTNTFNIPEGVAVIGGIDVSKGDHMYCQATSGTVTVNGVTLYGKSTDDIRAERVRYDINKNSVVEPWEMENQTILSGLSVGSDLQVKNVYHVINCNADEKSVGKLPEYFSDNNLTTVTTDAAKETTTSRLNRTILLDGLVIRDGSAMGYETSVQNKLWYFRGGGIMVDGTEVSDDKYEDGVGAPKRSIPMVVANTLFQNNRARLGGAIFTNGQLDVVGCSFVQNYTKSPDDVTADDYDRDFVTWSGGGAIATNDEVTIVNSIFANNEAIKGTGTLNKTYTDSNGKTNNETLGYGGVLWAGDNSSIALVNCNSVRNKAHSYPSIYNTLPNSKSNHIHIAVNSIFWGNEVDTDGDKRLANFGSDNDEALFFCAYEDGHGQTVKTSSEDLRAKDVTYGDLTNLYAFLGNKNNNVIINGNNDAVDGPNFIQPSTKAGIDGYMSSADWLLSRVNQLVDAGWGEIEQTTAGKFEKDDASGEFKAHGIYPLLSKFYKNGFKLTLLPLGDEKYMSYANDKNEESTENMNRISADPLGNVTKDYIDIGVYEYQHSQLTVADGDSIDVMWVSNEETTGAADGRSWDTPTSDLQRAIETLLLSRNDRPKVVKIMGGTYSPTYTLDENNNGFQIHTGENNGMVALKKKIISGHDYMAESLTIEGGYSKDIEGARDIEQYPTVLEMAKKSTSTPDNMAHLFLISDAEQWKTQGNRGSGGTIGETIDVTTGGINKSSTTTGQVMPITFDGLTFINNYASNAHTESKGTAIGGAAIYYKEQFKSDENTKKKTETHLDAIGVPKLTIKNCIFQQNGENTATSVPAVRIEQGGGRTLIYNSVFHSGSGNPLECTDQVSIVNCTFAMNGGHIKLSDAATGTSSLYNSLIWKDDQNNSMTTQYEGIAIGDSMQYNAITGIENTEEENNYHNVGLDDRNYNAMEGPNFVNGDGSDISKRDYHINPGVRTLTRANYLLYARNVLGWVDGKTIKDKDGNEITLTDDKIKELLADTVYTKDLANKVRLYDGSMERGAYECSSAMQRVLFVNPSKVAGTMSGLSWENAYGSGMVQRAIDAAAVYTYFNRNADDPTVAKSYVFIKGSEGNTTPEAITLRNGVSVYGSIAPGYTAEPDAVKDSNTGEVQYNNGARSFENKAITEYIDKVKAGRPGLAAKTTNRTRVAGISTITMKTGYGFGALVDGVEVRSDKELTAPAIDITDDISNLVLRNMMIDGNTVNADDQGKGHPVVNLEHGLLYNALVYGNKVAGGQPIVSVGSNGTMLNCTVVADAAGQRTVSNAGKVINCLDYNSADKAADENGSGSYTSCYAATGNPFAPYLRADNVYTLPDYLTSHVPYYYQLHENSKAINAGTKEFTLSTELASFVDLANDRDILGNPRTLGGTVDMGCFETWSIADGDSRYATADGNRYPHEGSVVYIGKDASLSLGSTKGGTQIFTSENAFMPGYLLLKPGASLYGNGNVIHASYVAAERSFPKDMQYTLMSMPFPYDYSNALTTTPNADGSLTETKYDIPLGKTYNGEKRSAWDYSFHDANSECWEELPSKAMKACEGWLLHFDQPLAAETTVRFTGFGSQNGEYVYSEDQNAKTVTLTQYNTTKTTDGSAHFTKLENMGWNLKGMPWLVSGYKTYRVTNGTCDMNVPHVLYTVSADGNNFNTQQSWTDGSTLDFGSAFFTQTAIIGDKETVTFAIPVASDNFVAPAKPFVALSDEDGRTDNVEVDVDDEAKGLAFNIGSDGVKWQSFNDSVPQVYLLDGNGVALSLAGKAPVGVEMAMGYRSVGGRLTVALPDVAAFDGKSVWLKDKATGEVTDLTQASYSLNVAPGYNDNRLTLTIGGVRPYGSSDSSSDSGSSWTVSADDGHLVVRGISDGDAVTIYSVGGAMVERGSASGATYTSRALDQGVYIVRVNGSSKKVSLRLGR
ncbi:right-handed parallel beta-helix repeat-containing protein [Prevotella lacticifex]|nr:right-handed parallel beta-helix repeat-containing protein [Prevotella lacticifex]